MYAWRDRISSAVLLWVAGCILLVPTIAGGQVARASAAGAVDQMALAAGAMPETTVSPRTGLVTFVSASPGFEIPLVAKASDSREVRARKFLGTFGEAFGLNRADGVEIAKVFGPDEVGMEHVRFRQIVGGVPVTGGELTVHLRGAAVVAVNAKTLPDLEDIVTTPGIWDWQAEDAVREALLKHRGLAEADLTAPRLELFNKGLLDGTRHATRLAWFVEATAPEVRDFYWVDAQRGVVLLSFSQLAHARQREIYDAGSGSTLPGTHLRSEGDPATGDADADLAYDYAGHTYDYFSNEHGRDSYDGAGATIISTVHYCPSPGDCPYQNAAWNGTQMIYGDGFPAADDIVAHELTHAVTDYSANLFYYMQSGALSESYSDIFGETVDQGNASGTDTPAVRWLIGEDVPTLGAGRDMMDPTTFGDPGKMSDLICRDGGDDAGGVHSNSGVPNHAYALMVDGGSYNGYSIIGIGSIKAAKIQYRALSQYLLSASDFLDNYDALLRSCTDLIGTAGISATNCIWVELAMNAVELSDPEPCWPFEEPASLLCPLGGRPTDLFYDDFETTTSGQWTTGTEGGPNHWTGGSGDHGLYRSFFSTSDTHHLWGRNIDETADSWVGMDFDYSVPPGVVRMQFAHSYGFESFNYFSPTYFDGGVVEHSLDGGATWVDAAGLMAAGASYNGPIFSILSNPLGGRTAFVDESHGYTETRLDLSSLAGQSIRFRFRIGTDEAVGDYGWFIDDFRIYGCETLYDQTDFRGSQGTTSQQYEPLYWTRDSMAADDFAVPAGETWDIDGLLVDGHYQVNGGPAPLLNVEFLSDSASLPGSADCTYTGLLAGVDFTDSAGVFHIQLPSTCSLPVGDYWVMAQADKDYAHLGQWFWNQRTLQSGSAYVWQNPGDGWGSGCTSWTTGTSCGALDPDLLFSLWGETSVPECYALSLTHSGAGSNPAPPLVSSPGCAEYEFKAGTVVTLTAAPALGWGVSGWTGTNNDASTLPVQIFTMPGAAHAVSVVYAASSCYTLGLSHSGSGADPSPSPPGSPGCAAGEYHATDLVTLTAAPDAAWAVGGWAGTDDDTSTLVENTVVMQAAAHDASVAYVANPCYSLTLGHFGTGSDPSPYPDAAADCLPGEFHAGDNVTMLAEPDWSWSVESWTGSDDDSSTSVRNGTTMPAGAHSVTVTYAQKPTGFLAKLEASDSASSFGRSVGVSGDTAVVGAPGWSPGAAYVYERDLGGPDQWGQAKKLTPRNTVSTDDFGQAVAISGDTIAIGTGSDFLDHPGFVYVFERNSPYGLWGETSEIQPPEAQEDDDFGASVALDGNTLAVGAPEDDNWQGAVWIFERDQGGAGNWGMVRKVVPADPWPWGRFGSSIAIAGDLMVAAYRDIQTVYFFERNQGGPDNWGEIERKSVYHSNEAFGDALAVSGDMVAIGSYLAGDTGLGSGSVNVYSRDAGGVGNWGLVRKLLGDRDHSNLGRSVALSSAALVAGAPDGSWWTTPGLALVFERDLGGVDNWAELNRLFDDGVGNGEHFGVAAAIDEMTIVVGTQYADAAYVFQLQSTCYELTLTHAGPGLDPVTSPSASEGCDAGSFHSREIVTLTASPDPGWEVNGWTGTEDDSSTSTVNALTMPAADHAASVTYSKLPCYGLTLGHSGSGADPSPSPNNSPTCPQGEYHADAVVALTAAPDPGWQMQGWSGTNDDISTSTVNSLTMPAAAHTASVAYAPIPCYSLTLGHIGSGTDPSPSPSNSLTCAPGEYYPNEVVSLTALPDSGWGVTGWVGTDNDSRRSTENHIHMPAADHLASVTYGADLCWGLTFGHSGSGADPSPEFGNSFGCIPGEYLAENVVNLMAAPDPGWVVSSWSGTDDDSSTSPENTVTMPAAVHAATVAYTEATDGFVSKLNTSHPYPFAMFGRSVAISGDTAVVGAPGETGLSADVFERDQGGTDRWGLVKHLAPTEPITDGLFGWAVAISGDTIAVGGRSYALGEPGAVYIFVRNHGGPGNWGEVTKIQPPEDPERDFFGESVAIDGNTLAVGAPFDRQLRGAAWIFERDQGGPGNWGMVRKVTSSDPFPPGLFGFSLALEGDLMIVERPSNPDLGFVGDIYFFERNQGGADHWGQVKKKVGSATVGEIGSRLALSGDTMAIGDRTDSEAGVDAGAVNVYRRNAGGVNNWGLVRRLLGAGAQSRLGASVTLSSDILVAGATDASDTTPGLVRVYARDLGGAENWGVLGTLGPYDGAAGDKFGFAVGIDGATVVVGAPVKNFQFGSAYVFELEPPPACFTLTLTHTGSGSDPAPSPIASTGCTAGSFHDSEVVTLTTAPDPGWEVSGWTGTDNDSSTSAVNAVTMPAADHAASVAYVETPVMPDHLHIHDVIISSSHTYEACLSITAGPSVELMGDVSVVFRAPSIVLDSGVSIGTGVGFTADNAQPVACAVDPG